MKDFSDQLKAFGEQKKGVESEVLSIKKGGKPWWKKNNGMLVARKMKDSVLTGHEGRQ